MGSDSRMPLLRPARVWEANSGHLRRPLTILVGKLDWGEEAIGNVPKKHGDNRNKRSLDT